MLAMPAQKGITGRALQLFAALKSNGGWMDRNQLADATGKRVLSPHDVALIDRLIERGLAEGREEPGGGPRGVRHVYRAVPGADVDSD